MLKTRIKHEFAVYLSLHRRARPVQIAAHAARRLVEIVENRNYDFDTNGEAWLLNQLAATAPKVVFDVGANVGDWSAAVRAAAPAAEVHAFELVPSTALALSRRFRHDPAVRVVASGLLDEPGAVRVKHHPGRPVLSSVALPGVIDPGHPFDHEWLDVPAIRGDDYCTEHGVDHIDLLKIDAEGSDHLVLAGFERMLKAGAVDVVQFEYGRANIHNRFLLADFYQLLEDVGLVLGKLYPNHVDFRPYDVTHEDFIGPNFVAVRSDRADLIALLDGGHGQTQRR